MSWTFVALLVLALIAHAAMAVNVVGLGASDAAGNGLAAAFAVILGLVHWILVLVLLLMGRRWMPDWLALCAFIALPVGPALSIVAVMRGWSRYAPIVLPLPFLAVAIWAQLPFSTGLVIGPAR